MKPQVKFILTANDLLEGDVIYYENSNNWVHSLKSASVFETKEDAEKALAAVAKNQEIVGPYIAEVNASHSEPQATHFREEFRATGPSNYFHGKQEQANV